MKADAENRFRVKLAEVQAELEETQRKLNDLQQNKDQSQRFILSPEQQQEVANFQKKEAEARVELKRVQKDLRREVDQLETRVKGWNIFAMPFAVTACGILLAVYKRKLTAAK
jgi:multidrug resistance efflux pump